MNLRGAAESPMSPDASAPRVVRIITRLNTGGAAMPLLLQGIYGLDGYEQVLVAGRPEENEVEMESLVPRLRHRVHYLPDLRRSISLASDRRVVRELVGLFRRTNPAIIETHTAKAGFVGRVAAALYNRERRRAGHAPARVAHYFHGHVFRGDYFSPWKTHAFLQLERVLARTATDAIWVPCEQQARELTEEFGIGRYAQYRVVHYGLELDEFTRDHCSNRDSFRAELGLAPDDLAVGMVGRLEPVKNPEMFLRAAASVLRRFEGTPLGDRIHFLVIGDGTLRRRLETAVSRLGCGSRIRFLGTRHDRERFLSGLDVVALSSLNEGYPVALVEAMASGKPVVGTAVGGVNELVRPGVNGVLVDSGDDAAFASALALLVSDDAARRRMGEAGMEFVRGQHDLVHMLQRTREMYDELLGGREAGDGQAG